MRDQAAAETGWPHPGDAVRPQAAPFTRDGVLRSFDEAHDVVRAALIAERRNATIREWVTGLRRRSNVNVLPR